MTDRTHDEEARRIVNLDTLEKLAREATAAIGSPWEAGPYNSGVWAPSEKGGQTKIVDIRGWGYFTGRGSGALGLAENDAINRQAAICRHIAALSPDVCLELIAALAAKNAEIEKLTDRCAIYKDQVETGGKVIDDLRAQVERMLEDSRLLANALMEGEPHGGKFYVGDCKVCLAINAALAATDQEPQS